MWYSAYKQISFPSDSCVAQMIRQASNCSSACLLSPFALLTQCPMRTQLRGGRLAHLAARLLEVNVALALNKTKEDDLNGQQDTYNVSL